MVGQSSYKSAKSSMEHYYTGEKGFKQFLKVSTAIKKNFSRFQGNKRNSLFDLYINKCKDFLHYFGAFCTSSVINFI